MQIIYYLKTIGCAAVGKIKTLGIKKDGHYCKDYYLMRGKADIECFRKAIMYCIECKSLTGIMSDDQKSYRDVFHKPPDRIYILARKLEDVSEMIK